MRRWHIWRLLETLVCWASLHVLYDAFPAFWPFLLAIFACGILSGWHLVEILRKPRNQRVKYYIKG